MTTALTKRLAAALLALLLLSACGGGGGGGGSGGGEPEPKPLKVGVLLPLTGPNDLGWKRVLDWARDEINLALPEGSHPIELVYADTGSEELLTAAARLAGDPEVLAVVGPDSTADAEAVAPRFIHAKKLLVSPSASAEQLFKAFGGKKYFMRTTESDVAQLETMFAVARRAGATSVSLVTSYDDYGATFFNWFGFLAAEGGVEPRAVVRYEPGQTDCKPHVDKALANAPDMLFAVAFDVDFAACVKTYAAEVAPGTKVLFSDASYSQALLGKLGANAAGLEGIAPSEDPSSGFNEAFRDKFHTDPTPYSSNTFDALFLIAAGLTGTGGVGGETLADKVHALTDARGEPPVWGAAGLKSALHAIAGGEVPEIRGASGPLDYDFEFHVDPTTSYYTHWVVESGAFVEKEHFITGAERVQGTGAANVKASASLRQTFAVTPGPSAPREGLWALIVAGSDGWENYRHQADALAQYQLLKKNGLTDDRIILVLADDLATNPLNPQPGVVQNRVGGENLRLGAEIDYLLSEIDAGKLLDILEGKTSAGLEKVIGSTAGENVYVYLTGHGNQEGFFVDSASPYGWGSGSLLTSQALNDALARRKTGPGYRQTLLVVEACHSGTLGKFLTAPDALLLAAANPYENSLAANFRTSDSVWLADQFSYEFWRGANEVSAMTLQDAYLWTYQRVSGSHVTLYNYANFQGTSSVALADFLDADL